MSRTEIYTNILNCFFKEFQSVWVINAEDYTMEILYQDSEKRIPLSIETVETMNSYDKARTWYIENCVIEAHRERMMEMTSVEAIIKATQVESPYFVEYSRMKNGVLNYNQLCYDIFSLDDGSASYIMLGFRDIDVRKKAEIDDLTGLYTRKAFFDKGDDLLRRNPDESYDIMISDIIEFKTLNEMYGVDTADDILKWLGKFLSKSISDDVLIGRYGGDQMVIMTTHEKMRHIATEEQMNSFFKAESENGLPKINIKFGVYENIRHDRPVISSCDKAHVALNSIKYRYDKISASYDDVMRKEREMRHKLEDSMHGSLANEDFKVFYQPKHDAVTGELVGAEALIRWEHPEFGMVSPGDFIPLFEKNGFIVETDEYVWKRSCQNIKRWSEKGIDVVPISVNASKLTIEQDDLIKKFQTHAMDNRVSPRLLHIEITETLMTDDVEELVRKLSILRAMGYQIELDDFGAGYSSINILSTLPLDVVKLDMSFMKQFGDEKRAKVLAASINLAKELGYKTVSEGVERKEQCEMLGFLGVDIIQGYYYAKPMPEDEFEKYMIVNR